MAIFNFFTRLAIRELITHIQGFQLRTLIMAQNVKQLGDWGTRRKALTESKKGHRVEVDGKPIIDGASLIAQSYPDGGKHKSHTCKDDGRDIISVA